MVLHYFGGPADGGIAPSYLQQPDKLVIYVAGIKKIGYAYELLDKENMYVFVGEVKEEEGRDE